MSNEPRKRTVLDEASDLLPEDPVVPETAPRPAALIGGVILVALRAVGGPIWMLGFITAWPAILAELKLDGETAAGVLWVVLGTVGLWAMVLLILGIGVWRGSNSARMLVQTWVAISITSSAFDYFAGADGLAVRATLLTLALDILILLALSSRSARVWTRGRSRRWAALEQAASPGS